MTNHEVMQMALDVLNYYEPVHSDDRMYNAITTLEKALEQAEPAIKEGWKVVPTEPTNEMIDASDSVKRYELNTTWLQYEAFLSAAPEYKP